jgi:DNA-directed RNA polymerase subunit RPC12/RpoP
MPVAARPRTSWSTCSPRTYGAFAHGITDIAKYEQITERRPGKRRHILRLAGHKTARKAFRTIPHGRGLSRRRCNLFRQRRVDRDLARARKIDDALCEFGVLRRQCSFDFAMCYHRIKRAIECAACNARRIIKTRHGVHRARYGIGRSRRKQDCRKQGGPDARRARSNLLRWFQFVPSVVRSMLLCRATKAFQRRHPHICDAARHRTTSPLWCGRNFAA